MTLSSEERNFAILSSRDCLCSNPVASDYTMVQERQEKLVTMYSKQEKALDVLKVRPCK